MSSSSTNHHCPTRRRKVRTLARAHGVTLPDRPVCRGHSAPLDGLVAWVYDRPPLSLTIGPRGGGKSYLAGLATHLDSIRYDRHGTRILGGSLAQSQQIYAAIADFDRARPGQLARFGKESTVYRTGSSVAILAASPKSVRGPHVPTLRLDEVDEIADDLRESAMGMCMSRGGVRASVSMTSTWHRVGGPMTGLVAAGEAGAFPLFRYCLFEVLERCPEERSGPNLERCSECPLFQWCHDDDGPRAKRSSGHYTIDSACQKVLATSRRVFEADYLCLGPKADGLWFPTFSSATHVTPAAEYDPALPVTLAIDSGVFTGAVAFQIKADPSGGAPQVVVFWDYLSEGTPARQNARAIVDGLAGRHGTRLRVQTDPSGGARNPIGPTVLAEYAAEGLRAEPWPGGSVADALALVEGLLIPATGTTRLRIHPRCVSLGVALRSYRRAKRAGQWQDYPEDPQHPHEDLVDALRGGLRAEFPSGLLPPRPRTYAHPYSVLY